MPWDGVVLPAKEVEINVNDKLLIYQNPQASNGFELANNEIAVDSVVVKDTTLTVYNFEVEELHNYLVGEEGILVHNDCPYASLISKLEALGEDYLDVVNWLKRTDLPPAIKDRIVSSWEIEELKVLSKQFKSLPALQTELFDPDALNLTNLLIKKSDASLVWSGDDYKYFYSLIKEAGDNYSATLKKLADSQFYGKIYKIGKGFEDAIELEFKNGTTAIRTLFNNEGINIDNYLIFKQVQLRVTLKDGTETYMVADFLLVEKQTIDGVLTPNFNKSIIVEAKASAGTYPTPAQNVGISITNSGGTLSVRSQSLPDIANNSQTGLGKFITNNDVITPKKFYKIWSQNGEGKIVDSMKAQ